MTDDAPSKQRLMKRKVSYRADDEVARESRQRRKPANSTATERPDQTLKFLRLLGNRAAIRSHSQPVLQAKLRIGQPNDAYEQEADRVADQVMSMSVPARPLKPG
jgi:hypothetical protein